MRLLVFVQKNKYMHRSEEGWLRKRQKAAKRHKQRTGSDWKAMWDDGHTRTVGLPFGRPYGWIGGSNIFNTLPLDLDMLEAFMEEFSLWKYGLDYNANNQFPRHLANLPWECDHDFGLPLALGMPWAPIDINY